MLFSIGSNTAYNQKINDQINTLYSITKYLRSSLKNNKLLATTSLKTVTTYIKNI